MGGRFLPESALPAAVAVAFQASAGNGADLGHGNHRLQALKKLAVRTIVALLVPDPDVAFKILALNTE